MIELVLTGGLGNQLFEYAMARDLQIMTGDQLVINSFFYTYERAGRSCSLGHYKLSDKFKIINERNNAILIGNVLRKINPAFTYRFMSAFHVYIWKGPDYIDVNLKKGNNTLFGYFQSYKYFDIHKKIISQDLELKEELSPDSQRLISIIENTDSVCIHIRRGDYVKKNLVVCDIDYFRRSVRHIKEQVENPKFFVFSDDIDWARKNIADKDFLYIDKKNSDYIDLEIMRHCKHFIMSNSTFSWWAQYLSNSLNKIVTAPCRWMPHDVKRRDIYMPSWHIIED